MATKRTNPTIRQPQDPHIVTFSRKEVQAAAGKAGQSGYDPRGEVTLYILNSGWVQQVNVAGVPTARHHGLPGAVEDELTIRAVTALRKRGYKIGAGGKPRDENPRSQKTYHVQPSDHGGFVVKPIPGQIVKRFVGPGAKKRAQAFADKHNAPYAGPMSEEEFEKFGPHLAPDGNYWEHDQVKDEPLHTVWSIIEGENDALYASPGFHVVNVLGYLLTKKPWTDSRKDAVWMEPTKAFRAARGHRRGNPRFPDCAAATTIGGGHGDDGRYSYLCPTHGSHSLCSKCNHLLRVQQFGGTTEKCPVQFLGTINFSRRPNVDDEGPAEPSGTDDRNCCATCKAGPDDAPWCSNGVCPCHQQGSGGTCQKCGQPGAVFCESLGENRCALCTPKPREDRDYREENPYKYPKVMAAIRRAGLHGRILGTGGNTRAIVIALGEIDPGDQDPIPFGTPYEILLGNGRHDLPPSDAGPWYAALIGPEHSEALNEFGALNGPQSVFEAVRSLKDEAVSKYGVQLPPRAGNPVDSRVRPCDNCGLRSCPGDCDEGLYYYPSCPTCDGPTAPMVRLGVQHLRCRSCGTEFPRQANPSLPGRGQYDAGADMYFALRGQSTTDFVHQFRRGDRFTVWVPAGRGSRGQEWARKSGTALFVGGNGDAWLLSDGSRSGGTGILATARNTLLVRRAGDEVYRNTAVIDAGQPVGA